MAEKWQRALLGAMRVPTAGRLGVEKLNLEKLTKAAPAIQKLLGEVLPGGLLGTGRRAPRPSREAPIGGRFLDMTYRDAAGEHGYKLFVPDALPDAPPLLLMLHGCTQSPDDFAAGTRMNQRAVAHGCLVAYPEQTSAANAQRCWNWFRAGDQRRDSGEPALLAGIARAVMQARQVDPRRVYAAGLSAGGAAAAVLAQAYPELFAAVGVHSGLACGAAHDVPSAFTAMRQGHLGTSGTPGLSCVPAIVFHGDRDTTVNPTNADAVIAQRAGAGTLRAEADHGRVPGGRDWTRTRYRDARQRTVLERWVVHGEGHAWSGGSAEGSYTDPGGPDASQEMLRFFMEHPKPV